MTDVRNSRTRQTYKIDPTDLSTAQLTEFFLLVEKKDNWTGDFLMAGNYNVFAAGDVQIQLTHTLRRKTSNSFYVLLPSLENDLEEDANFLSVYPVWAVIVINAEHQICIEPSDILVFLHTCTLDPLQLSAGQSKLFANVLEDYLKQSKHKKIFSVYLDGKGGNILLTSDKDNYQAAYSLPLTQPVVSNYSNDGRVKYYILGDELIQGSGIFTVAGTMIPQADGRLSVHKEDIYIVRNSTSKESMQQFRENLARFFPLKHHLESVTMSVATSAGDTNENYFMILKGSAKDGLAFAHYTNVIKCNLSAISKSKGIIPLNFEDKGNGTISHQSRFGILHKVFNSEAFAALPDRPSSISQFIHLLEVSAFSGIKSKAGIIAALEAIQSAFEAELLKLLKIYSSACELVDKCAVRLESEAALNAASDSDASADSDCKSAWNIVRGLGEQVSTISKFLKQKYSLKLDNLTVITSKFRQFSSMLATSVNGFNQAFSDLTGVSVTSFSVFTTLKPESRSRTLEHASWPTEMKLNQPKASK